MNNRRENLTYLVDFIGTQTELAKTLKSKTLSQQILSSIERGKRPMHDFEAREIEQKLSIPRGWMDLPPWTSKGWELLRKYRALNDDEKRLFDELAEYLQQYVK